MPELSRADFKSSPPQVEIPRDYNAAHDLIERNLAAGRAGKVAYIDDRGLTVRLGEEGEESRLLEVENVVLCTGQESLRDRVGGRSGSEVDQQEVGDGRPHAPADPPQGR